MTTSFDLIGQNGSRRLFFFEISENLYKNLTQTTLFVDGIL